MANFEYINIKIAGSKGCIDEHGEKICWDNTRLIITKNGFTTVENLAGGIEKMEDHLNNQLSRYKQQGWQPVSVERLVDKNTDGHLNPTIYCFLKRSIKVESGNLKDKLSKNATKMYQDFPVGA
ncbi:MAG: hypothetical protein AB1589_18285 [Cyanobacteriota bacterium]